MTHRTEVGCFRPLRGPPTLAGLHPTRTPVRTRARACFDAPGAEAVRVPAVGSLLGSGFGPSFTAFPALSSCSEHIIHVESVCYSATPTRAWKPARPTPVIA